jgi:hypothetical protein
VCVCVCVCVECVCIKCVCVCVCVCVCFRDIVFYFMRMMVPSEDDLPVLKR